MTLVGKPAALVQLTRSHKLLVRNKIPLVNKTGRGDKQAGALPSPSSCLTNTNRPEVYCPHHTHFNTHMGFGTNLYHELITTQNSPTV